MLIEKAVLIAIELYEGMRDPTDPHWDELDPAEQNDFRQEARGAMRQRDPVARAVAEEAAAQAYAAVHGWDWPTLEGYRVDLNRELAVIEARQRIRHIARQVCRAYVKHLQDGGIDGPRGLSFEASFLEAVKVQNRQDDDRRQVLKPSHAFIRAPREDR